MKTDHGAEEAARHGIKRSSHWPAVERAHLAKEPRCRACRPGQSEAVQVHHIFPFHYAIALGRPDLELDDRNLITLCETEHDKPSPNHHLLLGHLDDFKSSNLAVVVSALSYFGDDADEIKRSVAWQGLHALRLKPLNEMTDEDKASFKAEMDKRFPLAAP